MKDSYDGLGFRIYPRHMRLTMLTGLQRVSFEVRTRALSFPTLRDKLFQLSMTYKVSGYAR